MTLSDLEGHFGCSKPFYTLYLEQNSTRYLRCVRANLKAYVSYDFICRVETDGLSKVTNGHVQL